MKAGWVALLSLPLALSVAIAQEADLPLPLPKSAIRFPAGERITLNGLPFRMTAFSSTESKGKVFAWFARTLGAPLKIDTVGDALVLGKMNGGRYTTVQLTPMGTGVQGVVAVSDLKQARGQLASYREQLAQWLTAWPDGARVVSDMTSEDRGKYSRHVVVRNPQGEDITGERLAALLARDGYQLERAVTAAGGRGADNNGRTLYFKGQGKEAMATISRDTVGGTVTVLNTIATRGELK